MTATAMPSGLAVEVGPTGAASMVLRQFTHALRDLWRSRVVFVTTFMFPLTWLLLMGAVVGNDVVDTRSGIRLMQFVTPTVMVMGVLFAAYPTVAASLAEAREAGVIKRLRGTPMPSWAFLAGHIAAVVLFAVGSLSTMLVVGVFAFDVEVVWAAAPAAATTTVVAIASFAALGCMVAAVAPSAATAQAAAVASAVVLSILGGLFSTGDIAGWTERVASVFPVNAYQDALTAQFDPGLAGSGWDLGALAMLLGWGLAGGAIATWRWGWNPPVGHTRRRNPAAGGATGGAVAQVPRAAAPHAAATTAEPPVPPAAMLRTQIRWAVLAAVRDRGGMFFAVAVPLGLYALITSTTGRVIPPDEPQVNVLVAAGMLAWAAAATAFVSLPQTVAVARTRGVLKRLHGTPLTAVAYLTARLVAALAFALGTAVLVLGLGWLAYDVALSPGAVAWALTAVVVGTAALAACGLAVTAVVPSQAVGAVGLGILIPLAMVSDVFARGDVPEWMLGMASVLPLRPLVEVVTAALHPSGPSADWAGVVKLLAWLAVAGVVAARTFRWSDPA